MRSATPACLHGGDRVAAADHGERRRTRRPPAPRRPCPRRTAPSRTRPWARSTRSVLAALAARSRTARPSPGRCRGPSDRPGSRGSATVRMPVGAVEPGGDHHVDRQPHRHAARSAPAPATARAVSMRSGSTSERPTPWPSAREEGEGHAAADQQRRRPRSSRCSTSAILSETLAPPSTAPDRALRRARRCARAPPAPGASAGRPPRA